MRLIFAGSGSAFTIGTNNYHSNMILENEHKQRLLIDCGSDARFALHELGLKYSDIGSVYISHLHADHAGGLEWLGFSTKFDANCQKPNLYICEKLVDDLWNKVLAGGLSSIQTEIVDLSSFFQVHAIAENSAFNWHQLKLHLVQTLHVMAGFKILPSYGLLFTENNIKVFITTDTQFSPNQIKNLYEIADLIFHDCETATQKSQVHAHYDELCTLPEHIKKKMWLYHYSPGQLPDAIKDGFLGFVQKGQCFDFNDWKTLYGCDKSA